MSQEPQNPNTDQWRDQLVARALEERLGGESPPDISAQILSAATEADPSTTGDVTMATTTVSRSWNVRSWVLAASVLVNCGLIAALLASRTSDEYALAANQAANEPRAAGKSIELSVEGLERNAAKDDYGVIVRDGRQANEDFNDSLDILASTVEIESGGDRSAQGNLNGVNLNTLGTSGEGQQGGGQIPPPAVDSLSWQAKDKPIALYDEAQQDAGQGQAADRSGGGEEAAAIGSGRLPSGYYMQDDVQYFAPEAEVQLAKEAAAMDGLGRGRGVEQQYSMEATTRKYSTTRGPRDETAAVPDHKVRFGVNADAGVTEFAGGVEEPSRNKSFDSYDVELAGIPQPSEPPIVYPDSNVWADLATERPTWGYADANGQRWPRDNNIGEPGLLNPNAEWYGSPDGEGLGPGAPGDQYERIHENRFIAAIGEEAVSTFSIDVDTASYANVRQMLVNGQVPPPDAVRLEELVNYFDYDYEPPASPASEGGEGSVPFAAHVETAACPWQPGHRLVRVGIKGREIAAEKRPLSNLVFLVDVSGSMNNPEKLPLVKHGLKKLAEKLGENDRVAIVVYASSEGLALPSTPGTEQETILAALEHLQAGGSTAGGAGIQLAYQIAEDNFITGGTNRVILCTDGDFNVGVTNTAELERMVEQKAKDTKVFLSCIGFGRGNLNDAMMEKITGIGNGNYYYADDEREAERIFVKGMTGMLVTIAKDVKIQVEFNPAKVLGYRLLGYENRMLKTEDFNDDTKDAGEIGAGHTVTCLYEIVPTGEAFQEPDVDELKYQHPSGLTDAAETDELLTLKMRYKQPDEDTSSKLEWPVTDSGHSFGQASTDMQFAAAVASFGMLLRNSQYKGNANYDAVIEIADSTKGDDPEGDRAEFVELVRKAKQVMPPPIPPETEADPEPAVEPEAEADNPPAEDAPAEDDVEAPSDQ